MSKQEERLSTAWQVLRIGLGLGMLLAGIDKFFDLLTNWSMYLSPLAERLLPVGGDAFMRIVGVWEALLGLAILTRWARLGGYLAAAWLLCIAVNLAITGSFWDLAVRDVEVALSAFTLARLAEWRASLAGAAAAPEPMGLQHGGAKA